MRCWVHNKFVENVEQPLQIKNCHGVRPFLSFYNTAFGGALSAQEVQSCWHTGTVLEDTGIRKHENLLVIPDAKRVRRRSAEGANFIRSKCIIYSLAFCFSFCQQIFFFFLQKGVIILGHLPLVLIHY